MRKEVSMSDIITLHAVKGIGVTNFEKVHFSKDSSMLDLLEELQIKEERTFEEDVVVSCIKVLASEDPREEDELRRMALKIFKEITY